MIEMNVSITGDKRVNQMLLDISRRCEDLSPAFELMHEDFLIMEGEQFDSQGKGAWDPWTDTYRAWREARGASGSRIMEWDGKLRRSLAEKGTPGHVVKIEPLRAKFGTDLETKSEYGLGRSHQYGYKVPTPYGNRNAKATHVKARPLIELDEAHKKEWMRLIQGYVMKSSSMYPEHF